MSAEAIDLAQRGELRGALAYARNHADVLKATGRADDTLRRIETPLLASVVAAASGGDEDSARATLADYEATAAALRVAGGQ